MHLLKEGLECSEDWDQALLPVSHLLGCLLLLLFALSPLLMFPSLFFSSSAECSLNSHLGTHVGLI